MSTLHNKAGETVNLGGMVPASIDVNAAIAANVDAAVAAQAGLRLVGYSARESDGTPAVATAIIVHGATGAGGTSATYIELAANASETVYFGNAGIDVSSGISINHIAGTLDVCLYYKVIA